MVNKGVIRGKDLQLYCPTGGNPAIVAHATDCTLKLSADINEVTTKDGLKGKSYSYGGKYSYTLELKGITNFIDQTNVGTFQQAILQSEKLQFIFTDSFNVQYTGQVLIPEIDFDSPVDGVSTFTNTMQGDGELLTVVNSQGNVPIGLAVDIIDQFDNIIVVVPAPGSYTVVKFDTIEQGGAADQVNQIIIIPAA